MTGILDPDTGQPTPATPFEMIRGENSPYMSNHKLPNRNLWLSLYVSWKDQCMISDVAYCNLRKINRQIPPLCQIKKFVDELDKKNFKTFEVVKNDGVLGSKTSSYTRSIEKTIIYDFQNCPHTMAALDAAYNSHSPIPDYAPTVEIRVGADGRCIFGNGNGGQFHQTINCIKIMFPFGRPGNSPDDENLVGVHEGKEGYEQSKAHFLRNHEEIVNLHGKTIEISPGRNIVLKFVVCCDYKYLLNLFGLSEAKAPKGWCVFCECTKEKINDIDYNAPPRTLTKEHWDRLSSAKRTAIGWLREPLVYGIEVIPDVLHMHMRISLTLMYDRVMKDALERGREKAVEEHMCALGISGFRFYKEDRDVGAGDTRNAEKTTGKKRDFGDLNGNDLRKFEQYFDLSVVYGNDPNAPASSKKAKLDGRSTLENMQVLFRMWASLQNTIEGDGAEGSYGTISDDEFLRRLKMFGTFLTSEHMLKAGGRITPYAHIVIKHTATLLAKTRSCGGFNRYNVEGVEGNNRILNRLFRRASSFTGGWRSERNNFCLQVMNYCCRKQTFSCDPELRSAESRKYKLRSVKKLLSYAEQLQRFQNQDGVKFDHPDDVWKISADTIVAPNPEALAAASDIHDKFTQAASDREHPTELSEQELQETAQLLEVAADELAQEQEACELQQRAIEEKEEIETLINTLTQNDAEDEESAAALTTCTLECSGQCECEVLDCHNAVSAGSRLSPEDAANLRSAVNLLFTQTGLDMTPPPLRQGDLVEDENGRVFVNGGRQRLDGTWDSSPLRDNEIPSWFVRRPQQTPPAAFHDPHPPTGTTAQAPVRRTAIRNARGVFVSPQAAGATPPAAAAEPTPTAAEPESPYQLPPREHSSLQPRRARPPQQRFYFDKYTGSRASSIYGRQ